MIQKYKCLSCKRELKQDELSKHGSKDGTCCAQIPIILGETYMSLSEAKALFPGTPNQSFPTKEEK